MPHRLLLQQHQKRGKGNRNQLTWLESHLYTQHALGICANWLTALKFISLIGLLGRENETMRLVS